MWLISKLCLVEEIKSNANAKNSMLVILTTFDDYSYYMQLNLRDNFLCNFDYCTTILFFCLI